MKKLLLVGLIMLLPFYLLAQKKGSSGITYGVKAGVTFPWFYSSDSNESTPNTSFYIGGTTTIPIAKNLSIQPGLFLINKGNTDKNNLLNVDTFEKTNLLYLELPVNLITCFKIRQDKLFVGAGPYLGLALRGRIKTSNNNNGPYSDKTVTFGSGSDKDFKSTDFGFNLLSGYQLKNGFSINGSYGFGITNIDNYSTINIKNTLFSLGLGFSF